MRFAITSAALAAALVCGVPMALAQDATPVNPNQQTTPSGGAQGTPGQEPTTPGQQPTTPTPPTTPGEQPGTTGGVANQDVKTILEKIHETNLKEIRYGELARQNAKNEDVKKLGERLVKDHRDNDQKVVEIARKKGIELKTDIAGTTGTPGTPGTTVPAGSKPEATPGATPTPQPGTGTIESDPNYTRFQGLKGQDFDREFVKFIAEEHEKVMNDLKGLRDRVQDPEVKQFLQTTLPVLHEHHQIARKVQKDVLGEKGDKGDKGDRGRTDRDHKDHEKTNENSNR